MQFEPPDVQAEGEVIEEADDIPIGVIPAISRDAASGSLSGRRMPRSRALVQPTGGSSTTSTFESPDGTQPGGPAARCPDALNMFYGLECHDESLNALPDEAPSSLRRR